MRSMHTGMSAIPRPGNLAGEKITIAVFVLIISLLLPTAAFCFWPLASPPEKQTTPAPEAPPNIEKLSQAGELQVRIQEMAAQLVHNLSDADPERGELLDGLLVCTFVDLKKLYRTSSFGRYLAEQLMSEFQQHGYRVVEMRKGNAVIIQEKYGEYGLSRNPEEIKSSVQAGAMLTGTYVPAGDHILVNAKIVDNRDATLLSSASIVFPRNGLGDILLSDSRTPTTRRHEVTYMKRLEM